MKYFEEMPGEGGLIASYKGQGTLTLDGGAEYPCEFEIEHHAELGVLLECDFRGVIPPLGRAFQSFTGTTDDGQLSVASVGPADYRSANCHAKDGESGATVFWHLRGVRLERLDKPRFARVHYGLTNFEFHGVRTATSAEDLPLTLRDGDKAVEVLVRPVNDYKRISRFIGLYRSVRVTCEARVDLAESDLDTTIDGVIGSLCSVASVARGTRIVWVYRYAYDDENRLAEMYHFSAWVGRFSSMAVFDDGPAHMDDVKRFIETAYPVYREKNQAYELGSNLIESYLAAKAEGDLLERRGVKLAVALELLKQRFLDQADCPVKEHIISKSRFERIAKKTLRPAIKQVLEEGKLDAGEIEAICEKIPELNRTGFSTVLRALFNTIGFEPTGEELALFVRQRNALVHAGHFYRYKPEDRKLIYIHHEEADNAVEESKSAVNQASYFFMLNFMDRLFVKFFGYRGAYLNRKMHSMNNRNVGNYDTLAGSDGGVQAASDTQ